jgi:hypothetical protein
MAMFRNPAGLVAAALMAAPCPAPSAGAPPPDPEAAKAVAAVLSHDHLSSQMVAYCEARAPAQAAAVRAAWQRWREAYRIAAFELAVGASVLDAARSASERQAQGIVAALAAKGPAETVCAQMPATWSADAMDLRRLYPLAYRADGTPAWPGKSASSAPPTVARPIGTVYTPAQLSALAKQWRDSGRPRRETGPFYLRGRLLARGEHVFLEPEDDAFRARTSVHPDIDLRAHVGQRVVLEGYFDEPPDKSLMELQHTRLVLDTSGLTASPLPQSGLYRAEVALGRVRAAPGRGIPSGDLAAVLLETRSAGTDIEENVYYLLRDGTAYRRGELPPSDLDVARSRELEPQQWARWRKNLGGSYEIQQQDDFGKPDGPWHKLSAVEVKPWASGSRPAGVYAVSRFHGSIALGGVYSRSSITLGADGRFTSSRYAQGGSGSMAAATGFTGSATSHSDGTGTRSATGGGNAGVFAGSRSSRDDGAEHRGTYVLEGYVAELHYDSGRVERGLSFPAADGRSAIYWFHSVYLRQ